MGGICGMVAQDIRVVPACELIGASGAFRLLGGRTVYDPVMFDAATVRGDRVRLVRLDVSSGRLRQINRYVDWDQPLEVLELDEP